jgi:hypothetical protein
VNPSESIADGALTLIVMPAVVAVVALDPVVLASPVVAVITPVPAADPVNEFWAGNGTQ